MVVSNYNVELRDKNGNLKAYLTPFVSELSWEWNRLGGCGRCSITLKKKYRDIIFDARDDIQLRVKSGTTSKLVYRGYVANVVPTRKINEDIILDVRGYFDLLAKIVVQDTGDVKTYTDSEISVIVGNIVDTFVTPKTPITKGSIDIGTFEADTLQFLTTVKDALETLSDLSGDVEYGVDENLVFFWRTESIVISNKFIVGDNVALLERRVVWDDLANKYYLVGGTVLGSKYKRTVENTDSQDLYYLSEKIINNGSIISDTVADEYLGSLLREKSNPIFKIRAQIKNTPKRIEDTVPLGLIVFYDPEYDRDSPGDLIGDIVGEAADGGSDIIVGLTADGGSDVIIGGQFSAQIDRISYELSETPGRFNVTIQLGDTVLETAAKIKQLELALSNLQQY
ncbi:MAG: hypothetical protein WCI77_08085 [Candidatus Omnitrophota bacterium]